jgi:hypothetical protein
MCRLSKFLGSFGEVIRRSQAVSGEQVLYLNLTLVRESCDQLQGASLAQWLVCPSY